MPFTVLINENSGSVMNYGRDVLSEKLKISLGGNANIEFFSSEEFPGALKMEKPIPQECLLRMVCWEAIITRLRASYMMPVILN